MLRVQIYIALVDNLTRSKTSRANKKGIKKSKKRKNKHDVFDPDGIII